MQVRIGKAFLSELEFASKGSQNVAPEWNMYEIITKKGRKIKSGLSVDVTIEELVELIKECDWHTFMWSPEEQQSPDERKMYYALQRQQNSLNRVLQKGSK